MFDLGYLVGVEKDFTGATISSIPKRKKRNQGWLSHEEKSTTEFILKKE